ncbi:MAG: pirin family protein [Planctomycetes bacterium]|nr:pirin family protein [Planctomycetota bacterium]
MLRLRRSEERGHADHGWLVSRHTFSFADYHDPRHMGFGSLRVINEDRVAPGKGFHTHGHRDMEILSYVVSGAIAHEDSMGNGSTIRPGDVQRMSAGTGVLHSEFNPSPSEPLHFLQIWIVPEARGIAPGYEQRHFAPQERRGRLRLVGSRDGRDASVRIHQDAALYASLLAPGEVVTHRFAPGRQGWLQVVKGRLDAGGTALAEGDGLSIRDVGELRVAAAAESEFLLFDLA